MSQKIDRFDIAANRRIVPRQYTRRDRVRLLLWALLGPLFWASPRHLYGWRNQILRIFGARIGRSVRIYPSARIFAPWNLEIGDEASVAWGVTLYNLAPISIGARSIVSQNAHLCSGDHDFRQSHFPFKNRPIAVGEDCWICADAFIGPGVTLGRLVVVAARAAVVKSVPDRKIVGGNPASIIGER
jgi:putative colanic acid biosynthesis acetyltransferase WcaF